MMKIERTLCALALLCLISFSFGDAASSAPAATPEETATRFLTHLGAGEVDQALQLWTPKRLNARQKERIEKMATKTKQFGGIAKLKTPPVEKRPKNLDSHEVVVIVRYGNGSLAFGSFSFVEDDGQFRISNLRSEKNWGGTTTLFQDDEGSGASTGDVNVEPE
jgi:hypothetical protein